MNGHPSDRELRDFVRHTLPAGSVLPIDDHLASCPRCRQRAAAMGSAGDRLDEVNTDVLALDTHLSDDQVQHYATWTFGGTEREEIERHLARCAMCTRQVEDLRAWTSRRSRRHPRLLAAAAAIVLLALTPLLVSRWLAGDVPPSVQAALRAGVAEPPPALTEMMTGTEALMGAGPATTFRLSRPLATITVSDRPRFEWEPLEGAIEYSVAVFDVGLRPVAGPVTVAGTGWTPSEPLTRGASYVWQVTARRGTDSVTAPAPPAPPARFRVMDAGTAASLERAAAAEPEAHLHLGILYAQAGARTEAESHLRQVAPDEPHAAVAVRTLERLRLAEAPR